MAVTARRDTAVADVNTSREQRVPVGALSGYPTALALRLNAYMSPAAIIFILLMFTRIPVLYSLFNVEPSTTSPLWTLAAEGQ